MSDFFWHSCALYIEFEYIFQKRISPCICNSKLLANSTVSLGTSSASVDFPVLLFRCSAVVKLWVFWFGVFVFVFFFFFPLKQCGLRYTVAFLKILVQKLKMCRDLVVSCFFWFNSWSLGLLAYMTMLSVFLCFVPLHE